MDLSLCGEKTRESRKEGSWSPEDGDLKLRMKEGVKVCEGVCVAVR